MKPRFASSLASSRLALVAITFTILPAKGQTTWDGGGGADTNVNTASNWNNDTVSPLNGTTTAAFASGAATTATLNVDAFFSTITFNRTAGGFTVAPGGGSLRVKNSSSGGTKNLIVSSSLGGNAVINTPLIADNTLGNTLLVVQNNKAVTLDLNGPLSGTADFSLRYEGVASSITRIDGAISNLSIIGSASGSWAGDLIIGGDQSLATTDVTISSGTGFGTPTTAARLVLGESSDDEQTWRKVTLNNVMNLAIGGKISANEFVGNTANTKITGASATGNISFNSGTIGANVVLGGAGTHQNALSIIKKSSGVLNINSTTTTYTGATTVEAGTLKISSDTNLASPITVKAGATLDGEGVTSSSLTFDTGSSTLSFDPTTPGSLTASSLVATGATVIASPSGATTIDVSYTVLKNSSGNFSAGDVAVFLAAGRANIGGAGTNTITYTAAAPASLTWKGNDATNPTFWDLAATFNWSNGSPNRFFANDSVTFDNTASTFNVVVQGSSVSPGNIVFDNNIPNHYTVGGGTIDGTGSLTKNGTGTVTLTQSGTNAFSGALNINAGVLSISNLNQIGGSASTRAIQLGGGTLEYTYSTTNAQVSDTVPLVLNPGDSTLGITDSYITGSVNAPTAPVTLRLGAPITGGGNLVKSGQGVLAIGKNSVTSLGNTFSGTLTVTGGILDVRNPDSLGDTSAGTTISNAQLELFAFNQNAGVTFDAEPLTLSGNSYFRSKNEDSNSDIQNVWTGPVTISAGAVAGIACIKQVSTSSSIANKIDSISANISSLELSGPVSTSAGSTIKFGLIQPSSTLPVVQSDVPQTVIVSGALTGAAAVETQGEGTSLYTLVDPEYSDNTTINGGILRLNADNSANNSSTVTIATTGATLELNFDESGGAVTDTVQKLFIGGVQQNAGVYMASDNVTDSGTAISQITGPGTLTVTTGPIGVTGFNAWANSNGIPGALPSGDADLDGLSNLTEYALGTIPNASTPSPGTWSGNTITFTKGAAAIANEDVNYIIETSTDLGANDPWTPAVTQNAPDSSTTIAYTFTPGSPAKKFARLRSVLIP